MGNKHFKKVKVVVKIGSLLIEGAPWHKNKKLYEQGDKLDVPNYALKTLGTDVAVIKPPKKPVKEVEEIVEEIKEDAEEISSVSDEDEPVEVPEEKDAKKYPPKDTPDY